MTHDYDVIIVGGRPSGATLAARLGQGGLRVLLVERAELPSPPGASCPIIYASTMRLLDEIGAPEAEYARGTPKIRRMVNETAGMQMAIPIPDLGGRDYGYAIDRARFDGALFAHAGRQAGVDARDRTSLIDLLIEGDQVVGAVIKAKDGAPQTVRARLVVGADGRFSSVARKVGADQRDEHADHPTTLYYAYWRGVAPYDDQGAVAMAHGNEDGGYGFLIMDSADGTAAVAIEGRSDVIDPPAGDLEGFYHGLLQSSPVVWRRLAGAERVTDIRGMKKIGNMYRSPGGSGWALVGDAYHQKDPLDGQGIYDAVFTAKALATAILDWTAGRMLWGEALAQYDRTVRDETFAMYGQTLTRVQTTMYTAMPPAWLQGALMPVFRYLLTDPLVQERLGMMLTRQIPPNEALSPVLSISALLRGPLRDFSAFLDKQILPTTPR